MYAGDRDIRAAVDALAGLLPEPLAPLAAATYNYRWCWTSDGPETFAAVDRERWARTQGNPLRLLTEVPASTLERAAGDAALVERAERLADAIATDLARPARAGLCTPEHPAAFMCAEFGVHASLPVYSGGLGVLAGDILKEASDLALPMVGVGLMYRTGYFHQRIDTSGMQHEYWIDTDPERVPAVKVTDDEGRPVRVKVPIDGEHVDVQVWRVDVGRVPLFLLDTDLVANSTVGRWVSSRLYEGSRSIRLAQYGVLGVGGARVLRMFGIDPAVFHLNEGHPALATFQVAADLGQDFDQALESVRQRFVFTTHTPVPAGNETYGADEMLGVLGEIGDLSGDRQLLVQLGRVDPSNPDDQPGMTPLALRTTRMANGVSARHGEVARAMWQPLFGSSSADEVPITHVTNGVHVPTWLQGPMRSLLDRYLGEGWMARADDPAVWAGVDDIPDAELWQARNESRSAFVQFLRRQATRDRLRRGEELSYAAAAERGFDDEWLTIGFARRLAAYKRLYLLSLEPERSLRVLEGPPPVQFVFAGKAHPLDEGAKRIVQELFQLKRAPIVHGHVAFLEDYDMALASRLVVGCDVWVNVPRPPQEASGTSGMKACLNGALHLSVLDGWWAEGYEEGNGWAIDGGYPGENEGDQDRRHAAALFDLIEREVVPKFYQRDDEGLPTQWLAMIRQSLKTNGPRFSATRMVREYAERIYPT